MQTTPPPAAAHARAAEASDDDDGRAEPDRRQGARRRHHDRRHDGPAPRPTAASRTATRRRSSAARAASTAPSTTTRRTATAPAPARPRTTPGTRPDPHSRPARRRSSNPTFFDALPGPSDVAAVPNFVIRKFRVPVFLLPIYQAAGIQYGIRWEVLAAINEIETDYGRNLNISSAGALGWMQFMPSTWKMYGVDANKDGEKDPFNPVDAIFAAARYLKAAGGDKDMRRAVFAYNHAGWYVDSVMLRAKLITGIPGDLVGSLTGLTEGRFPVAAHAKYADDVQETKTLKLKKTKPGNAANVVASDDARKGIDVFAKKSSPVIAVNDGEIKKIGKDRHGKLAIVLQDVYGNRYTYRDLGSTAKWYPVPKPTDVQEGDQGRRRRARQGRQGPEADRRRLRRQPGRHAEGDQGDRQGRPRKRRPPGRPRRRPSSACSPTRTGPTVAQARRRRPAPQHRRQRRGLAVLQDLRLDHAPPERQELRPQARCGRARASPPGTVLGHVGVPTKGEAAHVRFEIRPAGRGAPSIDPKPILDGWKLLESTAIYRAKGKNVLYGYDDVSVGQLMLHDEGAAAGARPRRRPHHDLPGRPQRHQDRPDRPPRAGDARVPRRDRPQADRLVPARAATPS